MIDYKVFGENLRRMESRELGLYRRQMRETTENLLEREERVQMIDNEIQRRLLAFMDSWTRDMSLLCPEFTYDYDED